MPSVTFSILISPYEKAVLLSPFQWSAEKSIHDRKKREKLILIISNAFLVLKIIKTYY